MTALLDVLADPWTYCLFLLVFGVAPGFCVRFLNLFWPAGDPRRTENLAALAYVKVYCRPLYVAELIAPAVCEGLPARIRHVDERSFERGFIEPLVSLVVFCASLVTLIDTFAAQQSLSLPLSVGFVVLAVTFLLESGLPRHFSKKRSAKSRHSRGRD